MNPQTKESALRQLGRILQAERKKRGLTGVQLAPLLGISQSKLSKIEQGYMPVPSKDTVENMLDILEVSRNTSREVHDLLSSLGQKMVFDRSQFNIVNFEDTLKREKQADKINIYANQTIPALLQTVEFCLALMNNIGISASNVSEIMRITFLRQDLLWSTDKRYTFIIDEGALYNAPTSSDCQLAQLDKLDHFIGLENVSVGILPLRANVPLFSSSSFALYDLSLLMTEQFNSDIKLTEPRTIQDAAYAFAIIESLAKFGKNASIIVREAMQFFIDNKHRPTPG